MRKRLARWPSVGGVHYGPCTAVSGRRPCHAGDMLFDLGTGDCRLVGSIGVRDFSLTGNA
jgi:hypothetical protein